jgi:hypothetical protein
MGAVTATAEAPSKVFSWAYGHVGGVQAEDVAQIVESLYAERGAVTPEAVVELARPMDAPLHPAFEWDDAVAAETYRENQARGLLAKLVVSYRRTDGTMTPPTRYVVKLQARKDEDPEDETLEAATQPHVYIPIRRVMSEDVLRRKYVREAYLSVASWRRRYQDIAEFATLFEAIDALADEMERTA